MKFLLPCSCGRTILIDVSQAGQMVACACGQKQEAPTLRGIRALQPAEEENAKAAAVQASRSREWSSTQGWIFVVGMLLFLGGAAFGGYYGRIHVLINVPPPTAEMLAADEARFDSIPLDQMYSEYMHVRDEGIGRAEPPLYILAERAKRKALNYAIIGGGVALVGIVMAIGATMSRR